MQCGGRGEGVHGYAHARLDTKFEESKEIIRRSTQAK